jgi:hypothetical protein
MVQRGVTEVGLGTARKFSTARPIFQNLVQNVPVAGRSMYEMDLDLQKRKARKLNSKRRGQANETVKNKEKVKPKRSTFEENFDKYFSVQSVASEEVSTVLIVPLVPFEAPGHSLSPSTNSAEQSFLPFYEVSKTFQTHGKHGSRISSLFRKLDESRVWDRGAHYEAFGPAHTRSAPGSALCTSLQIVFDGWSAEMVKSVIGDVGEGWCLLKEGKLRVPKKHEGPRSVESSRPGTPAPSMTHLLNEWDAEPGPPEFIMPSIDFSSSFLDHTLTLAHPPSGQSLPFEDIGVIGSGASTPWMSDDLSLPSTRPGSAFGDYEIETHSEEEWSSLPRDDSQNSLRRGEHRLGNEAGVAFSAEFIRRSQDMDIWSNF